MKEAFDVPIAGSEQLPLTPWPLDCGCRSSPRLFYGRGPLMHKSCDGRNCPFPRQPQPQQALDEAASPWLLEPVAQHGSICLSAIPNSTFIVRQVWIAASL